MNAEQLMRTCGQIMDEVGTVIVGKRGVMEKVMVSILCRGHILFEDYPGLAKTLMANCFARSLGCDFKRIQFTPDLLPADITGSFVLDRTAGQFVLRKGPIFTNILLADEINRAPPKTQAALLEAMQEKQVTLEGLTHPLPQPFAVMATQNPIEFEGTYPLPEAQIDRFMMRLAVGYPSAPEEAEILRRRRKRAKDEVEIRQVCSKETLLEMQEHVEGMHLEDSLEQYMVQLVTSTRAHRQVEVGSSPRGSLALMRLSSARAAMQGRDYILPDDVKEIAVEALAHRLILAPDPWIRGVRPANVIMEILNTVPVPKVG